MTTDEGAPSAAAERRKVFLCSGLLFLIAFLPRFGIVFVTEPLYDDQYWYIAASLLKTGTYHVLPDVPQSPRNQSLIFFEQSRPTAVRPPATPFFLAACRLAFRDDPDDVRILTAVLGSTVGILIYLTARNLGHERGGVIAGVLWAFYPPVAIISYRAFQSEPIGIYVTAGLLYLVSTGRRDCAASIALGAIWGVGILNRSDFLISAVVICGYLAVILRYPLRRLALSAAIAAAIVAPWLVRNQIVFGSPVLTTLDGFALWVGNNPWTSGTYDSEVDIHGPTETVDRSPQLRYAAAIHPDLWEVDELRRSRRFKDVTWRYLTETARTDPLRLVRLYAGKATYSLLQPGETLQLRGGEYESRRTVGAVSAFVARLWLKIMCIGFLAFRKTSASELLLLMPMAGSLIAQWIAFPLPRYEVTAVLGCILFVSIKLEPWFDICFAKMQVFSQ
jgi:4-amino-4-deoxy-L-arabinose transferase-like glycosyltransferase